MEDSNGSKPLMVTSSLSFQVTTPSFYNQPKRFASVAPPRPKGQSNQSQSLTFSPKACTATVGRVGELPPPPSSISEDFPPPPPPVDAELPAPPPECQLTPPAFEAPPPAFPPPPPVAEDLPLPAPPEDVSFVPSDSSPAPAPPPPPPPPPAPPLPEPGTGVGLQKSLEKQTSFDRQLDSLTDMLSEMETRRPFNPKVSSQLSSVPTPKSPAPPPTAPKPSLSFLPPPELQDRPPPAPWAEELRARTTLRHGGTSAPSAPASGAPVGKGPAATLKTTFTPSQPASNFSPKSGNNLSSAAPRGVNLAPKVTSHISFPPPPAVPPGPPPPPANAPAPAPAPAVSNAKGSLPFNQEKTCPPPASPQAKPAPSSTSTASPNSNLLLSPTPSMPKGPGAGAPPGGVPLSMREVEELERMTKDFIKHMDNHAPVITSAPTEMCGKCGEALSRSQPAVRAMDKLFHSHCFCCMTCQRPLQGMQFYDRDGTPECEECYVNSLAICSRCGERITDRVLKAVGQCFHAHCFRCTVCSCTLEGSPFITDDNNNPYCVNDYHRRFSPLCVSCNEPIVPDPGSEETLRVVALEKNFHLKCYRCEDCSRPLSIEADADGCYPLDGRILCMKCHTKRAKQAMK